MEIKTLMTASLPDALKAMKVGETAYAPNGYKPKAVQVACSDLKGEGYVFMTSTKTGRQTVTRLK